MAILSWPEAIFHCDADAFFLSCELQRRPELQGKPAVVTGRLGGIILAKSYDLKAKGITTAMPIWEAKKKVPNIIVIPADFALYNEMSHRMFSIFQRWTPQVEVYSVDEAFLDMKGLRRLYKMTYPQMATAIKGMVKKELGITISIGVSVTKTLAKIASDQNKPDGITIIPSRQISSWLQRLPVETVPGFGRNTVPLLSKMGIRTCAEFSMLREEKVRSWLGKPGVEIQKELRGEKVYEVGMASALSKSIMRTSSFEPITDRQVFIWAHTIRHLERALEELHDQKQLTQSITLYLRDAEFIRYAWTEVLPAPSKSFAVLAEALKRIWREYFPSGKRFRSSGVTLADLSVDQGEQFGLFEDPKTILRQNALEASKEKIKDRYGRHAIRAASSLLVKSMGLREKKKLRAKAFNVEW